MLEREERDIGADLYLLQEFYFSNMLQEEKKKKKICGCLDHNLFLRTVTSKNCFLLQIL